MSLDENLFELFQKHNLFEKQIEIKRNEFLSHKGHINTTIYFIEDGSVKISVFEEEEQIIRFGYKGDFIVLLDSFLTDKPSRFYIQAIKKSSLHCILKERFLAFIDSDIKYLKLWNALLQHLILQQLEREQDLLIASSKERFQRVLKRNPKVFQEIPHKLIANYLRMSPETLSRLKSLDLHQ